MQIMVSPEYNGPINSRVHHETDSVFTRDLPIDADDINEVGTLLENEFSHALMYRGCEETTETICNLANGTELSGVKLDETVVTSLDYDVLLGDKMTRAHARIIHDAEFNDKRLVEALVALQGNAGNRSTLLSVTRDEHSQVQYRLEQTTSNGEPLVDGEVGPDGLPDGLALDDNAMNTLLDDILRQSGFDSERLGRNPSVITKIEALIRRAKGRQTTRGATYLWTNEADKYSARVKQTFQRVGLIALTGLQIDLQCLKGLGDRGEQRSALHFASGSLISRPLARLQVGITNTSLATMNVNARNRQFEHAYSKLNSAKKLEGYLAGIAAYLTSLEHTELDIDYRAYDDPQLF